VIFLLGPRPSIRQRRAPAGGRETVRARAEKGKSSQVWWWIKQREWGSRGEYLLVRCKPVQRAKSYPLHILHNLSRAPLCYSKHLPFIPNILAVFVRFLRAAVVVRAWWAAGGERQALRGQSVWFVWPPLRRVAFISQPASRPPPSLPLSSLHPPSSSSCASFTATSSTRPIHFPSLLLSLSAAHSPASPAPF
jgi:hypothetical protein